MEQVRVKICGITSLKDLKKAVYAGADAVGFVINVSQSPRSISMEKAKNLARAAPIFVKTVGVVTANNPQIEKICSKAGLDVIQVHNLNNSHENMRGSLPSAQLIAAIHIKDNIDINRVIGMSEDFDAVLTDSYSDGKYGGTGKTHNWKLSRQIREAIHPKPLILAGGLTYENVKEAIQEVKPYAVDVSSGVESSPGVKNRKKIFDFIKRAKEVSI